VFIKDQTAKKVKTRSASFALPVLKKSRFLKSKNKTEKSIRSLKITKLQYSNKKKIRNKNKKKVSPRLEIYQNVKYFLVDIDLVTIKIK
jgi:hypothetical protein